MSKLDEFKFSPNPSKYDHFWRPPKLLLQNNDRLNHTWTTSKALTPTPSHHTLLRYPQILELRFKLPGNAMQQQFSFMYTIDWLDTSILSSTFLNWSKFFNSNLKDPEKFRCRFQKTISNCHTMQPGKIGTRCANTKARSVPTLYTRKNAQLDIAKSNGVKIWHHKWPAQQTRENTSTHLCEGWMDATWNTHQLFEQMRKKMPKSRGRGRVTKTECESRLRRNKYQKWTNGIFLAVAERARGMVGQTRLTSCWMRTKLCKKASINMGGPNTKHKSTTKQHRKNQPQKGYWCHGETHASETKALSYARMFFSRK